MSMRIFTAQKMKFFVQVFFSKCEQICRKPRIYSHLLKKSLTENLTFCAVFVLTMTALATEISCKFANYQGVKYIN